MKNSFSSLQSLGAVREQIKTVKETSRQKTQQKHRPQQKKMFNASHELKYVRIGDKNVPVIQNEVCFVQYPTPAEQIRLPAGCVRATYNKEKKQVEYYARGTVNPIMVKRDSYHDPLPIPEYFKTLESVEEILDLDLETGHVTCEVRFDILDEQTHWTLRLVEYGNRLEAKGIHKDEINRRLNQYANALKEQRGVDVNDPNFRIPENVRDAISYIENRRFFSSK